MGKSGEPAQAPVALRQSTNSNSMQKNRQSAPTETFPAELHGLAVVALSDGTRNYGLYRVKRVESGTMLLSHGAISFPVGTHLDIEDYKYEEPNHTSFNQPATVAENDHDGIRLVW